MCSHVWCVYSGKGNRVIKAWEYLVKKGQHDLQGQVQWPPFSVAMHNGLWFKMTKWSLKAKVNDPISILSESVPTCMFCAKVVILAGIFDELSCRQVKFTDGQTNGCTEECTGWQTRAMTISHLHHFVAIDEFKLESQSRNAYWGQNWRFFSCVTLKFDVWPSKTIGHLFYATSTFVYHFVAIGEFKLELQSRNI